MAELLSRERCLQLARYMVDGAEAGSIAALWINLDRFQQVNHSLGYRGGDEVLATIARRLDEALGEEIHLGHMGADEFIGLTFVNRRDNAVDLAERMLKAIETPVILNAITLHPSARIGIALLEKGDGAIDLLQRADRAMLQAKREGTPWHLMMHSNEAAQAQNPPNELDIESKLHRAIETGGLSLHYQPILKTDGSVDCVEALMRCTVDGQQLSPADFIPIAEKTGLIIRLGEWTMSQGALFAQRLREAGYPLKVAVNISRAQLISPHFSQALNSALIYAKVPADCLELELTESLFMDMSPTVQENLCDARATGVSLAIDDFGTGYSCLANLKDIHATKLKLDRAFATALPHDQRAYAIVKAMTRLGQELGMTVVAEGIETDAQLQAVLKARVDAAQGYLYAHAMSGDTLLQWLHSRMQKKNQIEYEHDSIRK